MACLHFNRRRAHALGHEAFKIWIDGAVFGRDGIETGLRPPRRMAGLTCQQSLLERLLDCVEYLCLRFGQVACEIAQERLFAKASFIAVENNAGGGRWRRKFLGQRRVILARIRRPCRHIDESRNIRMYTRFGDDHPGKGMPDENRRPILPCQHSLGRGNRFGQCRQRVLHGRDVETCRLQSYDYLGPTRSVGKEPVHENDVARLDGSGGGSHAAS